MRPVARSSSGVIDQKTLFEFREDGAVVAAEYSGGAIERGYLVGRRSESGITFKYVQATAGGAIDAGESTCEITHLPDGRLRLTEHFQWKTRDGGGTNVIEEIDE